MLKIKEETRNVILVDSAKVTLRSRPLSRRDHSSAAAAAFPAFDCLNSKLSGGNSCPMTLWRHLALCRCRRVPPLRTSH